MISDELLKVVRDVSINAVKDCLINDFNSAYLKQQVEHFIGKEIKKHLKFEIISADKAKGTLIIRLDLN